MQNHLLYTGTDVAVSDMWYVYTRNNRVNDCISYRSSIGMDMRATWLSGSIDWMIQNASWLYYVGKT